MKNILFLFTLVLSSAPISCMFTMGRQALVKMGLVSLGGSAFIANTKRSLCAPESPSREQISMWERLNFYDESWRKANREEFECSFKHNQAIENIEKLRKSWEECPSQTSFWGTLVSESKAQCQSRIGRETRKEQAQADYNLSKKNSYHEEREFWACVKEIQFFNAPWIRKPLVKTFCGKSGSAITAALQREVESFEKSFTFREAQKAEMDSIREENIRVREQLYVNAIDKKKNS